ncbi:glycosyltransferase family 2 protein [Paenibacillus agricola]|uniref:Glycosyltransferase family 2 protein n=1 Tax=Paenibacillus agricola TaxID=2716264 RepID=A0ABX0JHX7_9BACL|nr:glycosyltransferase family 2 protein [Paenibacillus agricola]NHN34288.1 glycosyltransferase family 2 protein [Paenibacillus agricola]
MSIVSTVSVHIVTYNSEAYIQDCLDAVLAQSYSIQAIIVIDNHSSDKTEQLLRPYLDRITFVGNTDNVGFAGGHNQAIRLSEAEYVVVLNPDVTMNPDYIHFLIQQCKQDPSIGSATGKLLFKQSPKIIDSTGLIITKSRRGFDRGAGELSEAWNESSDVFGVCGAAALYRRQLIDDISVYGCFFDEDFFAYKEDVDVAWRSRIRGWRAQYCAEAIAYHDRGWKKGSRNKTPLFVRRLSYMNRYKMVIKNDSLPYLLLHCIPFMLYEVMSLGYFIIKEPKVLAAWANLFKNSSSLLAKRKVIQSTRKVALSKIYHYFK